MARKKDPSSIRQRAFNMLDNMKNVKRENALKALMAAFGIGESYAATLHAAHRTINKETGVMVKVYSVRDVKDGKPCEPYLKEENTFMPDDNAALSPEEAVEQYQKILENKIEIAAQLS